LLMAMQILLSKRMEQMILLVDPTMIYYYLDLNVEEDGFNSNINNEGGQQDRGMMAKKNE
jgi:hypothetical protein